VESHHDNSQKRHTEKIDIGKRASDSLDKHK
jgi:hypothetical protein